MENCTISPFHGALSLITFRHLLGFPSWLVSATSTSQHRKQLGTISMYHAGDVCLTEAGGRVKMQATSAHSARAMRRCVVRNGRVVGMTSLLLPKCFQVEKRGLAVLPSFCTPKPGVGGSGLWLHLGHPHPSLVRAMAGVASSARDPPRQPLGPAPSGKKIRVALCQLAVSKDKAANIQHAREAVEKAADEGANLIVLPEMWNCPYSNASFPVYAEEIGSDSPSCAMLSSVARAKEVCIVGGSIPERHGERLYNTCLVYDKDGELKAKHRKLHLFDIDIPGKISFKESETLTAGDAMTVVDTDVGRLGVGICYDIRFPELAMLYAAKGVHIICYPGAFNTTTGPLHWELLTRARAVDNQVYVVTCSPARDTSSTYLAWGHSTVAGPFGEVIATTEHEEDVVLADLDFSLIEERRRNMPLEEQRRGDLYTLINRKV